MSTRLYDYNVLPEQLNILFENYTIATHEVTDSYIYICKVHKDGYTKKTEYICVHVKKYGEPTIYSKSIDFTTFLGKCISNEIKVDISNNKKIDNNSLLDNRLNRSIV
jgi:hypothetical protein